MARQYRQAGYRTNRRTADRLFLLACALFAGMALLLPSPPTAADQPSPVLQPYSAQYKTTARGFNLTITRKLEIDEHDNFVLTNGGKMMVVGFHEISVFRVAGEQIQPRSYVYQGTGMINRRREIHFNNEPGSISSLYKDKWYELPYTASTLDRISQLEQLRLLLLSDPAHAADVTLQVADGKRVKDSHLVLVSEETLQTPLGPVATLHYQRLHDDVNRKSDIWVAPQWDYLMVKTVHVEDGDPVELMLTSASLAGQPLATP